MDEDEALRLIHGLAAATGTTFTPTHGSACVGMGATCSPPSTIFTTHFATRRTPFTNRRTTDGRWTARILTATTPPSIVAIEDALLVITVF